jgi:hypothetical protein
VKEMYTSPTSSSLSSVSRFGTGGDLAFSILETPNIPVDAEATEKFRIAFAYDERETLLGCAYPPICLCYFVIERAQISPVIFTGFYPFLGDCMCRPISSASSLPVL